MAARSIVSRMVAAVIGLVMIGGGIAAVMFLDLGKPPEEQPPFVRPLKTVVVGGPLTEAGRVYPGNVQANEEVDLAFQVAGPLVELPIRDGMEVEEGQLLGRIDPRDFENELAAADASLTKATLDVGRFTEALAVGAATEKELDDAKALMDVAAAQQKIATKALEDTHLKAPFAGRVARRYVQNFQNVQAKELILKLQDITRVDVEVNIPEERIVTARADMARARFSASFETLPGRKFDVTVKEFATEADPATQTYAVIFTALAPEDVTILPGMTVSVREMMQAADSDDSAGTLVPANALAVDGTGGYYVWRVVAGEGDRYTVHRQDVVVGEMMGSEILVTEGIGQGDRLAAAGVHLLVEGQQVRLMHPTKKGATP